MRRSSKHPYHEDDVSSVIGARMARDGRLRAIVGHFE
jgi:hypothetical protein